MTKPTYTLQAWVIRPDGPPIPDFEDMDQRPRFTDEWTARLAYVERVRKGGTEDLVILYQDGRNRPVRHSQRERGI